mgnify:CR=1 FL=1
MNSDTTSWSDDIDDDPSLSIAPLFLLSMFARVAMTEMQQPLFSLNVTGWALVLVMVVEEPEPVFKRVGVASDVSCEWFEGVQDVKIRSYDTESGTVPLELQEQSNRQRNWLLL